MADRIGCNVPFTQDAVTGIKRVIRNDKSALVLIRDLRNQLAHGSLSFTECGEGVTSTDLREITNWTAEYLRQVVGGFEAFIQSHAFLVPARRPAT